MIRAGLLLALAGSAAALSTSAVAPKKVCSAATPPTFSPRNPFPPPAVFPRVLG